MKLNLCKQFEKKIANEKNFLFDMINDDNFFMGEYLIGSYFLILDQNEAQDIYETQDPPEWSRMKEWHPITQTLELCNTQELDDRIYSSYPDLLNEITPLTYAYKGLNAEEEQIIEPLLSDFDQDLWNIILQKAQEGRIPDVFTDFIYNDFLTFFYYHVFASEENMLIENMLEIYKKGGFPCGWKGIYPKGNLIVYLPGYNKKYELLKKFILDLYLLSLKNKPA